MRRCLSIVVATIVVVSGCQERGAPEDRLNATPEYRLDATIKDIMDSFVDPSADYIWDAVSTTMTASGSVEKYPRTDEEWRELRRRAIQIMEGANLLLDQQQANGAWGAEPPQYHKPAWSTCFAILFLKQATRRLDVASTDRR